MQEHPKRSGLSLKVMMLGLLLVMAVAGGIAYLLVYPFFHRQHVSLRIFEPKCENARVAGMEPNYSGGVRAAASAIMTGIPSRTG